MYGLSTDVIRVGVSMRDVIDHVAERGYFPKASPERVWQRRLEKMAPRKPFQQYQKLRSGNEYILHYHPMNDRRLGDLVRGRHQNAIAWTRTAPSSSSASTRRSRTCSTVCAMFGPDERA
jgi:hypothetical protein